MPYTLNPILYLIAPPAAALLFLLLYLISRLIRRRLFLENLSLVLFQIRVPQRPQKEIVASEGKTDFKQEIKLSEQLFSALSAFKYPFILEAAVHHIGEEIHFYLAVQKKFGDGAMQQIHGLWPEAQIEIGEDYNIFNHSGAEAGSYLLQKSSFALPLRTYEDIGDDTFKPILGALSKIKEIGEGAAIETDRPAQDRKGRCQTHAHVERVRHRDRL
mgnify:CR=1 FL=1